MGKSKVKEFDLVLFDELLNVVEDKAPEEIEAIKRIAKVLTENMEK